jgi:hypothetical protein
MIRDKMGEHSSTTTENGDWSSLRWIVHSEHACNRYANGRKKQMIGISIDGVGSRPSITRCKF